MIFRSLRFRITSLAMVVVVGVLVVVGVVILQAVRSHLLNQVDQALINSSSYYGVRILHHQSQNLSRATPAGQLGQFFLPNGTLVGSSSNLSGQPPLVHVHPGSTAPRLMTIYVPRSATCVFWSNNSAP